MRIALGKVMKWLMNVAILVSLLGVNAHALTGMEQNVLLNKLSSLHDQILRGAADLNAVAAAVAQPVRLKCITSLPVQEVSITIEGRPSGQPVQKLDLSIDADELAKVHFKPPNQE